MLPLRKITQTANRGRCLYRLAYVETRRQNQCLVSGLVNTKTRPIPRDFGDLSGLQPTGAIVRRTESARGPGQQSVLL